MDPNKGGECGVGCGGVGGPRLAWWVQGHTNIHPGISPCLLILTLPLTLTLTLPPSGVCIFGGRCLGPHLKPLALCRGGARGGGRVGANGLCMARGAAPVTFTSHTPQRRRRRRPRGAPCGRRREWQLRPAAPRLLIRRVVHGGSQRKTERRVRVVASDSRHDRERLPAHAAEGARQVCHEVLRSVTKCYEMCCEMLDRVVE